MDEIQELETIAYEQESRINNAIEMLTKMIKSLQSQATEDAHIQQRMEWLFNDMIMVKKALSTEGSSISKTSDEPSEQF